MKYDLDKFLNIKNNRDGYNSAAPNLLSIKTTELILDLLNDRKKSKTRLTVEGGIAIYIEEILFIECYNDGDILFAFPRRKEENYDITVIESYKMNILKETFEQYLKKV